MSELPFGDASFDAVFAHNVIEHLREPVRALTKMFRVLRPGGGVGIRDDEWSAYLLEPTSPLKTASWSGGSVARRESQALQVSS